MSDATNKGERILEIVFSQIETEMKQDPAAWAALWVQVGENRAGLDDAQWLHLVAEARRALKDEFAKEFVRIKGYEPEEGKLLVEYVKARLGESEFTSISREQAKVSETLVELRRLGAIDAA